VRHRSVDSSADATRFAYYIVAILLWFSSGNYLPVPVGIAVQGTGRVRLIEMLIFLLILVVGYIWIWKKGPWNGYNHLEVRPSSLQRAQLPVPFGLTILRCRIYHLRNLTASR